MTKALDLRVYGGVQGVSFRYYTQREARRLGVNGWVRNEPDGSVAAHLEGNDAAVDELVLWCRTGPSSARVERVETSDVAVTGATSFDVRD
ncbi:acylphosphatase [Nocardioides sp.]|uniref:acylphosphatase n=1 Tax=Nocardioides sp. TaxID=35761 RepID=UPI0031FE4AC1